MTNDKSIFGDPENMDTRDSQHVETHLDKWMDILLGLLINPKTDGDGCFGLCIEKRIMYKTDTCEGEKIIYIPFKVRRGVIE